MTTRRTQYLVAMGIQPWILREGRRLTRPGTPADSSAERIEEGNPTGNSDAVGHMDWQALQAAVAGCTRCGLADGRTQTVFGVGDDRSRCLVVGEAPGAEEDRRGEPFVGRAGQLLNNMLGAIGLQREAVYITNVVKCRPPGNRDPRPEEVAACAGYLNRQIELIEPHLIIALGRFAAQALLKKDTPVGQLRGHVHTYEGRLPLVVTYHPAYLLRSPEQKARAWEDLRLARAQLAGSA